MKFICDATGKKSWFRLETEAEAEQASTLMGHAVAKHFRRARDKAMQSYKPASARFIEQDIGREAHVQRTMPLFLTLRDNDGTALVTAMLLPEGDEAAGFRPIIVGNGNQDPYPVHDVDIETLGRHFGLTLERDRCFPYGR